MAFISWLSCFLICHQDHMIHKRSSLQLLVLFAKSTIAVFSNSMINCLLFKNSTHFYFVLLIRQRARAKPFLFFLISSNWIRLYCKIERNKAIFCDRFIIIIWKAQGVPQQNNVAHPKHPEEEETSPNRNHIITGKQQQTN